MAADRALIDTGALLAVANPRDQRFTLTDAVSFEIMRRLRLAAAFAFDHHFEVAGYERLR